MLPLILEVKANWSPIMIRSEQICPRLMVNYVLRSGWVSICARGGAGLNLSTYIHSGTHSIQSGADISETNHSQLLKNSSWLFHWTQIFIAMTNASIFALYAPSQNAFVVEQQYSECGVISPLSFWHRLPPTSKKTQTLTVTPHLQWQTDEHTFTCDFYPTIETTSSIQWQFAFFRWSENKDTHSIGWG